MNLTLASMVKDELGRFLRPVFHIWQEFSDEIVILDDASTDGSKEFLASSGAHVFDANLQDSAWGKETPARKKLFDLAWAHTRVGDYILFLDADMIPSKNPRLLMDSKADGILFRLYDLWDEHLRYRSDHFWRGHLTPRLWMVRKKPGRLEDFEWGTRGIHSGHLPVNFACDSYAYAPKDFSFLHYAYSHEDLRQEKYVSYASVAHLLTDFERAHAASILDPSPNLEALPFSPEYTL